MGITVSTAELNKAVTQLTEKKDSFKIKLEELLSQQEQLASQWSGEASTAFAQAFQADKALWDNFAQVLEVYIQTLQSISQGYDKAEEINKSTASTRTYK
jgi:WXG100 family type VII secretion target